MESCGEIVITADYIDDLMTEEKLSSNDQKVQLYFYLQQYLNTKSPLLF